MVHSEYLNTLLYYLLHSSHINVQDFLSIVSRFETFGLRTDTLHTGVDHMCTSVLEYPLKMLCTDNILYTHYI